MYQTGVVFVRFEGGWGLQVEDFSLEFLADGYHVFKDLVCFSV